MDSYKGKGATVIGWGKTSGKQNVSSVEILKELEGTVVSQKECQETFGSGKDKVEVGWPKMCFRSDGAACHGDSG